MTKSRAFARLQPPLLIALLAACAAAYADAPPSPGIVAEKPADGPFIETPHGFMVPYAQKIPGTDVSFEMIPVAGGEFLLGSPAEEADRSDDEGPQVRVRVEPFWIGKYEVTWAEYHAYMALYTAFKRFQLAESAAEGSLDDEARQLILKHAVADPTSVAKETPTGNAPPADTPPVDAVTAPTPLYDVGSTYMSGEDPRLPAVTMTQFAARQYTKWLSGITAVDYRLPSEAEWEYAARAGSSSAYHFGDDPAELERYAWFMDNSDYQAHLVGEKEPNPWGLYDMHGNAAEWTLDQYGAEHYQSLAPGPVDAADAIRWPEKIFPHVARGGSWLDTADRCRSAARLPSEEGEWKLSDPNRPLSPWWYTEEPPMGIGLRVLRPLAPMTPETKRRAWDVDAEYLRRDVTARLKEGRGAAGVADPSLPQAMEAAKQLGEAP